MKGWLTSDNVRRSTIFLLGFGLRMSETDVSEFLTKVIKEEDFNPSLPQEVIYHYCYRNHLPWSFAEKKLAWYQNEAQTGNGEQLTKRGEPGFRVPCFSDENELDAFLMSLKGEHGSQVIDETSYQIFDQLVDRVKGLIAKIYQEDEELGENHEWKKEEITSADLEKIICCGIPLTSSGNLQKMSASLLNRHFNQKRISRQRIDKLLQRQLAVDRFDLITLLFFAYTQEMPDDEPEERCMKYMDEINSLLAQCHLSGLYPVNAYEAFILMCLLSESPLSTYSEIWEMSYQQK